MARDIEAAHIGFLLRGHAGSTHSQLGYGGPPILIGVDCRRPTGHVL